MISICGCNMAVTDSFQILACALQKGVGIVWCNRNPPTACRKRLNQPATQLRCRTQNTVAYTTPKKMMSKGRTLLLTIENKNAEKAIQRANKNLDREGKIKKENIFC